MHLSALLLEGTEQVVLLEADLGLLPLERGPATPASAPGTGGLGRGREGRVAGLLLCRALGPHHVRSHQLL